MAGDAVNTLLEKVKAVKAVHGNSKDVNRAPDLGITLGDDDLKAIAQARAAIAKARGEA